MTEPSSAPERSHSKAAERDVSVASDSRVIWPWTRQSGESHQAFDAFQTYVATEVRGVRSIRTAARQLGKSRQLLERWSVRWRWVERCERYDFALNRLHVARRFAEAEEQARQLARASESVRYIAIQTSGANAELDRLMPYRDRLLFAALALPLDDLVALVGAEGSPAV
jgi:hypothetical protein